MTHKATFLIARYFSARGGMKAGAIRVALVSDEPAGRCHECQAPLYGSAAFDSDGVLLSGDLGIHRKPCSKLEPVRVIRRRVAVPEGIGLALRRADEC